MKGWIASVFFTALAEGLAFMIGYLMELSVGLWILFGLLLLWLAFGGIARDSESVAEDVNESDQIRFGRPEAVQTVKDDTAAKEAQPLHSAVLALTQELRSKEDAMDRMRASLTEREFRRSLSRMATIHETLGFTLSLLQQGKLSPSESVEQLRQEIEAAVSDLGLEHHVIQAGATIASLPPGSFVILRSEPPPSPALAGTVKDVMSTGLCARDEDGKPHFISPTKINAYKL